MPGPVNAEHRLFEAVQVGGELFMILVSCGNVDERREVGVDVLGASLLAEVVAESLLGVAELSETDGVIVSVLFALREDWPVGDALRLRQHSNRLSHVKELPGLQDVDLSRDLRELGSAERALVTRKLSPLQDAVEAEAVGAPVKGGQGQHADAGGAVAH